MQQDCTRCHTRRQSRSDVQVKLCLWTGGEEGKAINPENVGLGTRAFACLLVLG